MLRSEGMKISEACNSLTTELEQSKSEVKSLEQLVRQLEEEDEARGNTNEDSTSVEELKEEINVARHEISQLKSAVEVDRVWNTQRKSLSIIQHKSLSITLLNLLHDHLHEIENIMSQFIV